MKLSVFVGFKIYFTQLINTQDIEYIKLKKNPFWALKFCREISNYGCLDWSAFSASFTDFLA
jgi:hypothetical protein